nr:hypothetical protein [Tanacetum cinerariifolium]
VMEEVRCRQPYPKVVRLLPDNLLALFNARVVMATVPNLETSQTVFDSVNSLLNIRSNQEDGNFLMLGEFQIAMRFGLYSTIANI